MRPYLRGADAVERLSPQQRFQGLKAEVHRQMVEVLDLSQLDRWNGERLRREVSALTEQLASEQRRRWPPATATVWSARCSTRLSDWGRWKS